MAKRKIMEKSQAAVQETLGSEKVDMQERGQAGIASISQPLSNNESNDNDEDLGRDICEAETHAAHATHSSSLSSCQEEFKSIENTKSSDRDDKDYIKQGYSYAISINAMVSQFPIEGDDSPIQPSSPSSPSSPSVVTLAQVHATEEDCQEDFPCSDSRKDKDAQSFNETSKANLAQNKPLSLSDDVETCMPSSLLQESSVSDMLSSSHIIHNSTPASPIISENSCDFETCQPASPLQNNWQSDILSCSYSTNNNTDLTKNDQEHGPCNLVFPLQENRQPDISPSSFLMNNNMLTSSDINSNDQKYASPVISQYSQIVRPKTPDMLISPDDIFSPNTKASIKETIRALYPDLVQQPVIPVKKRKKGDVPYIVGCTSRRRVPEKPCLNVFKGDKYGITSETNAFDDDVCPPKKRSRLRKIHKNWTKSRFNPNSSEIAARLKLNEKVDELLRKSPTDETTFFTSKPSCSRPQAFSPLPSTSKDSETIMKNEKHFNESLNYDNHNYYDDSNTVKSEKHLYHYDIRNYDIGDDEDLPEVILDLSDAKKSPKRRYNSLLRSKDIDTLNKGYPVFNEIINNINNNNNNGVAFEEYDFTKIRFKKHKPETIVKSDSPTDDNSINETPEIIDTIEINDDYGSHLANKTSQYVNVDSNIPLKNMSSVSIIEIPDVEEPSTSNKSSATRVQPNTKYIWNEDVEFVSETPLHVEINSGNEVSLNNNGNITAESSNNDIGTVVNNFFSGKNINNINDKTLNSEMTTDVKMLFSVLTDSCSKYLPQNRRKRFAMSNIKNLSSNTIPVPQKTTVIQQVESTDDNNENAAPSPSALLSSAIGERSLGDCPICMENMSSKFIASTPCGHVFCLECIKTCLRTSGKRCPTCRKQLKGTGYHQVFL